MVQIIADVEMIAKQARVDICEVVHSTAFGKNDSFKLKGLGKDKVKMATSQVRGQLAEVVAGVKKTQMAPQTRGSISQMGERQALSGCLTWQLQQGSGLASRQR
jgi:hypothetical protein